MKNRISKYGLICDKYNTFTQYAAYIPQANN